MEENKVPCKHGKRAPRAVLEGLEVSQAGAGRHRCAVCAYEAGFEAGLAEGIRRAQEALLDLAKGVGK